MIKRTTALMLLIVATACSQNNSPVTNKHDVGFVKSAHYFSSAWPKTFWQDFEEPDVAAGFILAENVLATASDPLRDLLQAVGTRASFQLLTTGSLEGETLDAYARLLLTQARNMPQDEALLAAFAARDVRSTPYAYALDVTGETVLPLIEADPVAGRSPRPLLSDADWLRLQSICGG